MSKRDKEGKVHMHEYDENWKCSCGFRLIIDPKSEAAVVNIKAFVTPNGETVELRSGKESETDATAKPSRKKKSPE
jgi:hypothetical protein